MQVLTIERVRVIAGAPTLASAAACIAVFSQRRTRFCEALIVALASIVEADKFKTLNTNTANAFIAFYSRIMGNSSMDSARASTSLTVNVQNTTTLPAEPMSVGYLDSCIQID
jgi:hypothetical protein